jgi:ABC-2 type transport system permease protein
VRPLGRKQAIELVATRELRQRMRARSFKVGTAVIALLASALVLLPVALPGGDDREWTLAVTGRAPAALERTAAAAAEAESATIEVRRVDRGDPAVLARRDGIDAVLVDGRELVAGPGAGDALVRVLTGAVARSRLSEQLAEAGVGTGVIASARDIDVRRLGRGDDGAAQLVSFLGVVALFFAIATYGAWVLHSVLEEKANRVVEIVASTVSPRRLLAGKVLGNGLAGLAQFTTVIGAAIAVATAAGTLPELPGGAALTAVGVLGWFILGFAFYAVGYAAAGSLVSRQEDAQSAVAPMMTIVMTSYFVSLFIVNPDPGATAARIVSFIPPVTPMAMPARIAAGEVAPWEIALAVALMLAATVLMVRLAARIYTAALLRTGVRVRARDALQGATRTPGG